MSTPPVILAIAGFDPCGGAGLLADVKTIHALGGYGVGVITAQTVQNTLAVRATEPVSPTLIRDQLAALLDDTPPQAVKVGMLANQAVSEAVLTGLARWHGPLVMDPVLASSSGHVLYDDPLPTLLPLLRRATLITPNRQEATRLAATLDCAMEALPQRLGCAVLLTGGDEVGELIEDRLLLPDGQAYAFRHARVETRNTHGTGCTLSSAIATLLAQDKPLPEAVSQGIEWLQQRLAASDWRIGQGRGPIRHLKRD